MKRRIAHVLFVLAVAMAARAAEPPATSPRESLAAEIRQIESEINRLNLQIDMVPSREIALRQPLDRQLREKQQALLDKQQKLAALPSDGAPGVPSLLSDAQTAALRPIVKLFKEGKADAAVARWTAWLKSKDAPKVQGPAALRMLAAWVAGQASAEASVRDGILDRLLAAAPKPAKE